MRLDEEKGLRPKYLVSFYFVQKLAENDIFMKHSLFTFHDRWNFNYWRQPKKKKRQPL